MGGLGSGNHRTRWGAKTVVEDCASLDVNKLTRNGVLVAGHRGPALRTWFCRGGVMSEVNYEADLTDPSGAFLRLWHSRRGASGEVPEAVEYQVRLTTTRSRLGGLRWWFVCPLAVNGLGCERRVGKLYLPPRGHYFGCRRCHNLTYRSCQESHKDDALLRMLAINMGCDVATVRRLLKVMTAGPPGLR
jgi:hypothetical protein